MPNELTLITCCDQSCQARIMMRSAYLDAIPEAPAGVYEIECPRCGAINTIYWTSPSRRFRTDFETHSGRAPDLSPDEYVQGSALVRRQEARRKHEQEEERRRRAIAQAEQRRKDEELGRHLEAEERKRQQELAAAAARSGSSDSDDGDDSGGGRCPNDVRSDAMNPNNDAHQAAMDNHANQMNPNNEAYWSSRGR